MFIWHLKHYRNYKSIVWDLCMQHLFNVSCWSAVYICFISVLQILVHCDGNFDFMWISPLSGTSVHCHKQSTLIASICHIFLWEAQKFSFRLFQQTFKLYLHSPSKMGKSMCQIWGHNRATSAYSKNHLWEKNNEFPRSL